MAALLRPYNSAPPAAKRCACSPLLHIKNSSRKTKKTKQKKKAKRSDAGREEPRETWYQPEGFLNFLATSRESCRSGVERWDVWGWAEWIRHKVYLLSAMDDGTWGFSDDTAEVRRWTPPEAILAVLRLLHKNLSSPFWSVRSGIWDGSSLVDFCLKKRCCGAALWFVCHLFYFYAPLLTDMPPLPHAKIFHLTVKTRHTSCSAPRQIKSLSRKSDWDFVWPLNSQHATLLMGGAGERRLDRSAGYLYPISIMLTWCPYVVQDGV